MPSRATALLGDLGSEVSSRLSFMRMSYDLSTVVPDSRRITYGGDFCSSDVMELCGLQVMCMETPQFSVYEILEWEYY